MISNEMIMEVLRLVLYVVGFIAFAATNAAYLSLLERKFPSWLQLRPVPLKWDRGACYSPWPMGSSC